MQRRPQLSLLLLGTVLITMSLACGGLDGLAPPSEPPPPFEMPVDLVAGKIASIEDASNGDQWDPMVKRILLDAFDVDGSQWIDTTNEVASIPCTTWEAMDVAVRASWVEGIRSIYGLDSDPELIWVGFSIGLHESIRIETDTATVLCGLTQ